MARGLGTKNWAVGEVLTATNSNTYIGPPPNLIDIDPFPTAVSQTNWDTNVTNVGMYYAIKRSTGAQNALIQFDVVLAAGTWTLELIHAKNTDYGIATVSLSTDGTSFTDVGTAPYSASGSTIDMYAASGSSDNRSSITGIVIATTGRYCLQLKMATKNASSTNYYGGLQHLQLRRTA